MPATLRTNSTLQYSLLRTFIYLCSVYYFCFFSWSVVVVVAWLRTKTRCNHDEIPDRALHMDHDHTQRRTKQAHYVRKNEITRKINLTN